MMPKSQQLRTFTLHFYYGMAVAVLHDNITLEI